MELEWNVYVKEQEAICVRNVFNLSSRFNDSLDKLRKVGANIIGVVLNKFQSEQYNYYNYYSYYGYGNEPTKKFNLLNIIRKKR